MRFASWTVKSQATRRRALRGHARNETRRPAGAASLRGLNRVTDRHSVRVLGAGQLAWR